MDTVERTISYLFILSLILILVAYYAGSKALFQELFAGAVQVGNTYTGRNAQGQFAAYPK